MARTGYDVKLGADTKAFEAALRNLNKPIQEMEKSLKRLNEGLKLNPSNVTLLATKEKELSIQIQDTKNKLAGLREEYQKLEEKTKAAGKVTEEQARTFVRLDGEIATTEEELKALEKEYLNFGSVGLQQTHALGEKMKEFGEKAEIVANKLMKVSAAAAGMLAGFVKSASNWEDAWVGVTKTVNGTDEQMRKLEGDLLDMAKATGVSKSELASFAEAAGQSGIQVDNIAEYTKVISDLNVATNITGEEGARSIAKLFKQMQIGIDEVDNFGSAITALGNEFPTTEREILDLSSRLASTGEIVGLSGQEVLALATAMSSLGAEAEAGGTAMSKIFRKMQLAIANGGDQLEQFAAVSGMSVEEFTTSFNSAALPTLQDFIHGLADMQENGGDVIKTLDDMKLSEVRLSDQLLRLVGNENVLTDALALSNQSWEDNYALAEEADKRYGTLTYRMGALREQVDTIAVKLGNVLLPIIKDVIAKVQTWVEKFERLSPEAQKIILKVLGLVAAIGPASKIFAVLTKNVGNLLSKLPSLGKVISVLTNPITIVIASVAALIAIFKHLYDTNEEFRDKANAAWENIVKVFEEHVLPAIQSAGELIGSVLGEVWDIIQKVWGVIEPFIKQVFETLLDWWNNTGSSIVATLSDLMSVIFKGAKWIYDNVAKPIIDFLMANFLPVFKAVFEGAGNFVGDLFTKISDVWDDIKPVFDSIIQFLEDVFEGKWENIWNDVKNIFTSVFSGLADYMKDVFLNKAIAKINGFTNMINKATGLIAGGNGINIPMIPKLAEGAIVNKATLALVGEGKSAEAVMPLDKLPSLMAKALKEVGGSNITLQFYPQHMTEAELEVAFNYVNRRFGTAY